MGRGLRGLLLGLCLLAGGCAQKSVFTADTGRMCDLRPITLEVALPDAPDMEASPWLAEAMAPNDQLVTEIERNLAMKAADSLIPRTPVFLALSGGSEQGAFGAGILKGWASTTGHLPKFDVVTGISTGAILSTFAFVDAPDAAVEGYRITAEEQLLQRHYKRGGGDISVASALIRRGAVGDLGPLYKHLDAYITNDMLLAVAQGEEVDHRKLYIGAVDADSGNAVAFDMTALASRFARAVAQKDADESKHVRDCYLRAVIASSSAPMAAPPAFIDNRMYLDGGVRFGLFSDKLVAVMERSKARNAARTVRLRPTEMAEKTPVPVTYAIANGTLVLSPPRKCPKVNPKLCTGDNPTGGATGERHKWRFSDLALQTEKVLVNQVYRFSAAQVGNSACPQKKDCFRFLYITPDWARHRYTLPGTPPAKVPPTCADWLKLDEDTEKPVQFHWRYMRCMIDYGETRVRAAGWQGS
jgi:hypothetical protein